MDRRSIGSFIAALRRAKGMTQKDLAQLLHVSDKTVSRWEVGDGVPDLSLIPALAEIFDVSCDELLRGERRADAGAAETTPLGEKRRQWLLEKAMRRFNIFLIIAIGLALIAGIVELMLVEILDHRQRVVTSTICASVCAAGAVTLLVGLVSSASSLSGAGTDAKVARMKWRMVLSGEAALGLMITECAVLLIYGPVRDMYAVMLALAIFLAAAAVVSLLVNMRLRGRGFFGEDE